MRASQLALLMSATQVLLREGGHLLRVTSDPQPDTYMHTYIHTHTHTQRERERERERQIHTYRDGDRQTQIEGKKMSPETNCVSFSDSAG